MTGRTYIDDVFRIIHGALRLDAVKVRNYTEFLAEKMDADGEADTARRIRSLLAETNHELRPADVRSTRMPPVDGETRFPLVERTSPQRLRRDPEMVLVDHDRDLLNELISVAKSQALLASEGIDSSVSLLLYGPPGCGKSMLARKVARELGLELLVARLDGLISSFLGSTSKNIRALFEFASTTPCVLFLDEFDAIAKLRGDQQELGELKRVVNSFIQNLDALGPHTIVIAATNHEELLDAAVWRRFSYRLRLGYPTADQRREMWHHYLRPVLLAAQDIEVLVDLSEGFSGSDISESCARIHRRRITSGTDPNLSDVFRILRNLAGGEGRHGRFVATLPEERGEVISALRARNHRLYSHRELAALLGISTMTAYRSSGTKGGALAKPDSTTDQTDPAKTAQGKTQHRRGRRQGSLSTSRRGI